MFASDLSSVITQTLVANGHGDLLKLALAQTRLNLFMIGCEMSSYPFKLSEQNFFVSHNHSYE